MAAAKQEILIYQLLYQTTTPLQKPPHIFEVQQLNDTMANTVRCNRKSEIQVVGRQTGRTYISASILDSNAVPKATSTFLGSSNSIALWRILSDVTGSRKFKMAAAKPEVLISQLLNQIATPFQKLPHICGVQQLNGTMANTARCNRKQKIQDGGRQTGSTYI